MEIERLNTLLVRGKDAKLGKLRSALTMLDEMPKLPEGSILLRVSDKRSCWDYFLLIFQV